MLLIIFLLITKQWHFFTLSVISNQLLAIFLLLIFTSGLSLITSALTVFYRDINFVTQMLVMLWFYVTPIVYPFSVIPQNFQPIFYLNPLSGIFSLLQSPITKTQLPTHILSVQIAIIILVAFFGIWIFRKKEKYFSDWL